MNGFLSRVYDTKWIIFGVALILLLLWIGWPFLDVFVYAIFVYYITRPIKKKLKPYIKSDSLRVLICMLVLVLPLILVISYTLLVGISELNRAVAGSGINSGMVSGPLANLSVTAYQIQSNLTLESLSLESIMNVTEQEWYKTLTGSVGSLAGIPQILLATGGTIADILFKLFLIFLVAFYLLRDDDRLISWIKKSFPNFMREHDNILPRFAKSVDRDLEVIFFGNILSIVFFAIVSAVTFSVLNMFAPDPTLQIPYSILMGILCGISALVPVVGMALVIVPLLLYIAITSLIAGTLLPNIVFFIIMIVVIFIFVETLPDFVLRPIMARGQVHTGLLMFAYILGPIVFGISGLFLGAIVLVLITRYFGMVVPQLSKDARREKGLPETDEDSIKDINE
ncbi:AI-2E family transporter [Methanocella sp. CWC-04]|uniref:AI-2E family transporter n=1 Tax=Methanooceanicella nereidis TaxID=2052831 RepID=A0AAP2RC00_9EURY|nr:AI-2E family transporter [Methanocella sp. CWC-04]